MRDRDPDRLGHCGERGDAGHELERHARVRERERLLPATTEHERVAAVRDRDRDRPPAVQRRQDERAELGNVGDVAEDAARLGVGRDAPVQLVVARRDDGEPDSLQVGSAIILRRDDGDDRTRRAQSFDLFAGHLAAAHDEATPARQVKAGDVVQLRRLLRVWHQTPTEWMRAPARSSFTLSSRPSTATETTYAPGPADCTFTLSSVRPSSASSAELTSAALSESARPPGSRRNVFSAACSPSGP